MKKNKLYKLLALALIIVMMFSVAGCGGDKTETTTAEIDEVTPAAEAEVTTTAETAGDKSKTMTSDKETTCDTQWAVYWYLCGSDLESGGGSASIDMFELMDTPLPENVKIIIQTGGSSVWQNDFVDPNFIERYVYDSTGLTKVEQQPLTSMGDEATLSSFLTFAKTNYPANKTMFLFWNHGGGTVNGAASDELFGGDALDLQEMHNAFQANYELSVENPPFDIIGFDTCLMATVDVAATFSDIGSYLLHNKLIMKRSRVMIVYQFHLFTGTIPKGRYGGGVVMLWDEGSNPTAPVTKKVLKINDFKAFLHVKKESVIKGVINDVGMGENRS